MPIDVSVPRSPGWWLQRLSKKLVDRQPRLELLSAWQRGDAPLPKSMAGKKEAERAFRGLARTGFAELAVEATRERMTPIGLLTGATQDDDAGDQQAWDTWTNAGMDVKIADALSTMLGLGDAYLITGKRPDTDELVITAEDPRQVVTEHDPLDQRERLAGLKMFHDPVEQLDLAYLYLPGRLRVAKREARRLGKPVIRFTAKSWEWDEKRSADLPEGLEDLVPVFRLRNRNGLGEFETHLPHLERINQEIYNRMSISTAQAFKQRALKGDFPTHYPKNHPHAGREIDYDEMLVADPGAVWLLPGAADLWESGQVELQGLLSAIKDDVMHFSAVTRNPLSIFNPDSANQSATGADFAREGLTFKAEDRIMRVNDPLRDVVATCFRLLGDEERADRSKVSILWAPVARLSITERADAAAKAGDDLPIEAKLLEVWQFPAEKARRYAKQIRDEREQDPLVRAARELGPVADVPAAS